MLGSVSPANTEPSAGPPAGVRERTFRFLRRSRESAQLRSVVRTVESAHLEPLCDAGIVAAEICHAGLVYDPRNPHGADKQLGRIHYPNGPLVSEAGIVSGVGWRR